MLNNAKNWKRGLSNILISKCTNARVCRTACPGLLRFHGPHFTIMAPAYFKKEAF